MSNDVWCVVVSDPWSVSSLMFNVNVPLRDAVLLNEVVCKPPSPLVVEGVEVQSIRIRPRFSGESLPSSAPCGRLSVNGDFMSLESGREFMGFIATIE